MKITKGILLILVLYAFLHNPLLSVFGGTGLCKVLYLVTLVYIIFDYRSFIHTCNEFKLEFLFLFFLLLFVFFRTLLGGDPIILYSKFVLFIECFIIPIAFASYWSKQDYGFEQFVRIVLIVSSLAAVVSTACIMNPSFGSFVRSELQVSSDYILEHEFRGFGISDSLTSSFGYIQGACFVLAFKYIKSNKWVLLFMPFILFSAIINARTGVIITILGLFVVLVSERSFLKTGFSLAILIGVFVLLVPFFLNWINPSDKTLDFILEFWQQMQDYEDNNTVAALNSSIQWPSNMVEWVIGKGIDLFWQPSGMRSDIGYIIQLNYGGVVYLLILYGFILTVLNKLWTMHYDSFYPLFILLSLALLNYKADILNNTGYYRFVMLLYFVLVTINKKQTTLVYKRS